MPLGSALIGLLVAVAFVAAPPLAGAAACPSRDISPNGNCGPQFTVPHWTDAGGWTDPSQYSTIQLTDVNGDGRDELIGRTDAGIAIYWFDTRFGQWRPQVDASANPQLLRDFASFPPWKEADPGNPQDPWYYSTIQAADIDGRPGEEILARFSDGMRVYQYKPPQGTSDIDGGTWSTIGTAGPFSDADDYGSPKLYPTIQVGQFKRGSPPVLFARANVNAGSPSLVFYTWSGGTWSRVSDTPTASVLGYDMQSCADPSCYLTLQTSDIAHGAHSAQDDTAEVIGRTPFGVTMWDMQTVPGNWNWLSEHDLAAPFGDGARAGYVDCPFSAAGLSTGDGSGDCVGSSPSYYETLQTANVDGVAGDELLVRASDGLRARAWAPSASGDNWEKLATLTALKGAPAALQPGQWGTITTIDGDADGTREVMALDADGKLQIYGYDRFYKRWNRWQLASEINFASDPWLSHPEYYSTMQTGDIDGDGVEDLIARGPYGIRTWFMRLQQVGGWTSYLPAGYPDFPSAGQRAAFTALTAQAKTDNVIPQTAATVRSVWTAENAPQPSALTKLQTDLARIALCTGQRAPDPPSYEACASPVPADQRKPAYTDADWTAVVNQLLAELDAAQDVLAYFAELDAMHEHLLVDENAELPAIGDKLGLQVAAGSTAQYSTPDLWAGIIGIAASIAGLFEPEISAGLWVASEAMSIAPSASETAMSSPFPATYADLKEKFAAMASEIDTSLGAQSQQVRNDAGLLMLVSQLRTRGTWQFDAIGMKSTANQAFAAWAYRTLMPAVYDRYQITQCHEKVYPTRGPDGQIRDRGKKIRCTPAPTGKGVIGGGDSFTALGPPVSNYQYPCAVGDGNPSEYNCWFDRVPSADISGKIWGEPADNCQYDPGDASVAWHFGCSAGVDADTSVGANTWGFRTFYGNFMVGQSLDVHRPTGSAAQARARAPVTFSRARHVDRPAVRASARLRAAVELPHGLQLAGATVRVDRLLFERGHGELARPHGTRTPRAPVLWLRRAGARRYVATTTSGGRRVRVALRRDRGVRAVLTLRVGATAFHTPRACHALPAGIAGATDPELHLQSRLVIGAGQLRLPVALTHHLRCARDARGNVNGLERVRPRSQQRRSGLAVSLRGPREVQAGSTVRYVARVHNQRTRGDRGVASLWHVAVGDHLGTTRIRELRRGRSRTVVFTRRVPRTAQGRFCAMTVATAPGTLAARARACAQVRGAAPRFTG